MSATADAPPCPTYAVVVPVKPPSRGKSRLVGLADGAREELAAAFALDTVTACLAARHVGAVLVATDDRRWPALRPVALCADLPALDPADLDTALEDPRISGGSAGFVADAAGIGTTLYSAPWQGFDPRYGEGSRRAHLDAGAGEVLGALTTLRRDVDDLPDLQAAAALGVGEHTRRVLDVLGLF